MHNQDEEANQCVVRIRTSVWSDKKGLHTRRDIVYMHRLSTGCNILEDELDATDAKFVADSILNLDSAADGLYRVVRTNCTHDFESGYLDGYDLKLVSYSR